MSDESKTTKSRKNPAAVALGAKGGAAGRGEAKSRGSAAARAAVAKRWERYRAKKGAEASVNAHGLPEVPPEVAADS